MKVTVNATALGYIPAIVPSSNSGMYQVWYLGRSLRCRCGEGPYVTLDEAKKMVRKFRAYHRKLAAEYASRKRGPRKKQLAKT